MNVFLDSNILLYATDPRDPRKRQIARGELASLASESRATISTQVLQEYAKNALLKFKLPPAHVAIEVERFAAACRVVQVDLALILRAIEIFPTASLSYWDALILSAAERAGCERVLSEDMSHGQRYGSVTVHNPFLADQETRA